MSYLTFLLVIAATAFSGILAGASLDQSIKQLPARRRIGAAAYAEYAKAADLGNGIAWYAVLGIGAALLTIAAAILSLLTGGAARPLIVLAGILAVLHTLSTTQAAPKMFSLRKADSDEAEQARILDRFERWQTVRVVLQVLTLAVLIFALAANHGPVVPG